MKITLCLLTFNEIAGCKNDIPQLKKYLNKFDEIYAIDGGSKDGTIEYIEKEGIPVYVQPKKGLNQACHFAIEKCTTDAVIFFHPKGTIPVEDTLKFRDLFENNYDFVIGSRIIKGAINEEDKNFFKPRKWFVMGLALLSSILFNRGNKILWDVLHGFRGVTIKGYQKMNIKDEGMVTIDIEMVIRSYKSKLKSLEFPTTETARVGGETHFKAIPTGIKIFKYIKRELLRKD
jgi:glycosyltransferase involved in cell wall biosynthesis